MVTTCSGVLPFARITSGMPWRKRAVMVDLGEAQVLERHVAHAIDRRVDVHGSVAHLLQQRPELILIHTTSEYQKLSFCPV